jgi:hypothetical protein
MLVKRIAHQKEIAVVNLHAHNVSTPIFIEYTLLYLKGQ